MYGDSRCGKCWPSSFVCVVLVLEPLLVLVLVSEDRDYLYLLCPTEQVLPEDGDRIQSTKRCVLNKIQDDG
jgi:hypothetical protein